MNYYDCEFRKYELGTKLDFSNAKYNIINYFEYGISEPEDGFTWFLENEAVLSFYFDCDCQIIEGVLDLANIFQNHQRVSIYANDILVFNEVLTDENDLHFVFARPKDGKVVLRFVFPDAKSPFELGLSDDARILSLCVKSLIFKKFLPSILPHNSLINFLKDSDNFNKYVIFGISDAEDVGAWTNNCALAFALKFESLSGLIVFKAKFAAIFNEKQHVRIFANGINVFEKEVTKTDDISFEFLASKDNEVLLNIELENAASPSMLGKGDDERILALMFESISFVKQELSLYKIGEELVAKKSDFSLKPYFFEGLSFVEKDYVWTEGKRIIFRAEVKDSSKDKLSCDIFLKGVFNGLQEVIISDPTGEVFFGTIDNSTSKIKFDAHLISNKESSKEASFEMYFPNATSPSELDNLDKDTRVLALKIEKVVLY